MTLVIYGEAPAKKNSRVNNTKSGRSFPNPRYVQWHDDAILQVLAQTRGWKAPIPCSITITFFHGDKRVRDSDNGLTSILDMLKDCGVLLDDRWMYVPHKTVWDAYDKNNARAIVSFEAMKCRNLK